MRTREEVYDAACRAHEIARLLVNIGNAYGNPKSVVDIMEEFDKMQYDPRYANTTAIESGLIKLEREKEDMTFYTIYVQVGPSKDKREDFINA